MDGGQTLLHETKVSEGLTLITVHQVWVTRKQRIKNFFPRKSKTQNVVTKDTLKNLNSLPITKKALYQNNFLRTKATIVHVQKILALRTTKWTIVKKSSW